MHSFAVTDGATPSLDALCPFGGIEAFYQFIASGGQYIPKTHLSNLVLLIGLFAGTFIAGGAFCGWVCPFGAVQDLLSWIRRKLHIREIKVPARLDRILRYGRFVVLGIIIYQTIVSVRLWFADIDPYRTLFGLAGCLNSTWRKAGLRIWSSLWCWSARSSSSAAGAAMPARSAALSVWSTTSACCTSGAKAIPASRACCANGRAPSNCQRQMPTRLAAIASAAWHVWMPARATARSKYGSRPSGLTGYTHG